MWAPSVWPFQRATRASPWAMSSISISSGEGSSRSSLRPESIRCQARSSGAMSARQLLHRLVAVAVNHVVVHQPAGLHEGVNDGGADKSEAALFHVLGNFLRQRR